MYDKQAPVGHPSPEFESNESDSDGDGLPSLIACAEEDTAEMGLAVPAHDNPSARIETDLVSKLNCINYCIEYQQRGTLHCTILRASSDATRGKL
ncbi:hypothetical protein FIBSPDRAFT_958294 [Athelia psychrophila]|uniref:Uncharacterized protein n=1 Tax=Athelia psychrophila TaxID=1759441 RepID=A0A166EUE8_9AGAM|nr:hypothetical protein FIBSPDRAFT_958294 [Fibularhizoctonia sp. CBS 109695]